MSIYLALLIIVVVTGPLSYWGLMHKNREERKTFQKLGLKTNRRRLIMGMVLYTYSALVVLWSSTAVLGHLEIRFTDPAWVVGISVFLAALVATTTSFFNLMVHGGRLGLTMNKVQWAWVIVPCLIVTVGLAILPFQKVAPGSLVAENGRILYPGSPLTDSAQA